MHYSQMLNLYLPSMLSLALICVLLGRIALAQQRSANVAMRSTIFAIAMLPRKKKVVHVQNAAVFRQLIFANESVDVYIISAARQMSSSRAQAAATHSHPPPQPQAQPQSPSSLRVADHFPAIVPECKEQAARFFHCFETKSDVTRIGHKADALIGDRALHQCADLMKAYDDCMQLHYHAKKS